MIFIIVIFQCLCFSCYKNRIHDEEVVQAAAKDNGIGRNSRKVNKVEPIHTESPKETSSSSMTSEQFDDAVKKYVADILTKVEAELTTPKTEYDGS
ncbi:hypothetical protein ScPMuIL_007438 [Solemya velum]